LRTVFLGTSQFAAAVLERLAGGAHRPALVLTRPDRPRGRGRRLASPPVAESARALGLPLEQPEHINDPGTRELIERLGGSRADGSERAAAGADVQVLVVCAFGALIKEPLLSAYPLLNVHPSLLPRWRGAAPVERAIMAGDARTGVSIMRLTAGLDSGPVCLAEAEPIGPEDTYGSLAGRLQELGGELMTRALDRWDRGEPPRFTEQDEALATYAEKIGPADRLLDPSRTAVELERAVRALHPHIGARLELADERPLGVLRARTMPDGPSRGALADVEGRLLYGTRAGALELLEVRPPGGRAMDASAYLRGHQPDRA
jgi:methionyl-tRNA formyltransferase